MSTIVKRPTRKRVARFYTDTGRYMGWCYVSSMTESAIASWAQSGNRVVYGATKEKTR